MQDQVGDDARGDCHQQVVAGVAAAPVVAARRAAQAVAVVVVDHVGAAVAGPAIAMAAAPARRATVHDNRPRRVVPRTAMDHAGPADNDPAVGAAVTEIMPTVLTAVVYVGGEIERKRDGAGKGGCERV